METNKVKEEKNHQQKEESKKVLDYNWREAIASCSKNVRIIKDSEETN